MSFRQIVVSSNCDPTYLEFWEPVAWSYKRMFPDVTVHLALLADLGEDDPVVVEARRHGKVTVVRPNPRHQEFGAAKMLRYYVASLQPPDEVIYIEDIDVIACHKGFITDKTEARPKGHLLCVGSEVYQHGGTYPASQHTAEASVFKTFINPHNKSFDELMDEWSSEDVMFDRRENMGITIDWAADSYPSCERLLRRLIFLNPVPKFEMERGYTDFMESTVDRADWKIDMDKLYRGEYLSTHCLRPYSAYKAEIQPVLDYIERRYA